MGVVYKARDPEIGRIVAIKTLRKLAAQPTHVVQETVARFRAEARSAGNLRHPNIITIFEVSWEGDTPYIVMDYLEGEGLDSLIERLGKVPPELTLRYLDDVASALDYAHVRGVVHRDVKPGNLLVDKSGHVFILDFGVASMSDSLSEANKAPGQAAVMGSPGYMAPEQILNESPDGKADLFSLAVVAYECLTGERPFAGQNITSVVSSILSGKFPAPSEVAQELPQAIDAVFARALARAPADRYPTARDFISALRKEFRHIEQSSLENMRAEKKRKTSEWKAIRIPSREMAVGSAAVKPAASVTMKEPRPPPRAESEQEKKQAALQLDAIRRSSGGQPLGRRPGAGNSIESSLVIVLSIVVLSFVLVVLGVFREMRGGAITPRGAEGRRAAPVETRSTPTAAAAAPFDVSKLSDREILVLVVDPKREARDVVLGIQEAGRRKLVGLLDMLQYPLESDSFLVRVEALKVLAVLDADRRAVDLAGARLNDYDPVVRIQAAKTMAAIAHRAGLAHLHTRMLQEEVPEVRAEISSAIAALGGIAAPRPAGSGAP